MLCYVMFILILFAPQMNIIFGWPFGRGRLEANAECCQMLPYFCLWTVFLYLLDVGLNVGLPNKRVVVM